MANQEELFLDLIPQKPSGTWVQVDFHVHSPVSPDFCVSRDSDDPLLELLEQAKDCHIKIICITDHNDIRGYFQFQNMEKEIRSVKEGLQKRQIPIPEKIEQQAKLFDQVIVMPGIELDIYPNIHLLVIFNPDDTEESISNFLTQAGYPPNIRGDETAARNAGWTFTEAIEEAARIGAITIAAHIDSNKGLYEESKSWGQARIDAFTHPLLWGMEFIKTPSRDQVISLLKNDPNYLRKTPLSFTQSSDFHGKPDQKIGERRTFVRIDNLVHNDKRKIFEDIKLALRNPDEYISAPESPQVSNILKKLEFAPYVEDVSSEENLLQVYRYVCAYANTVDGTIVIGRNKKGNWVGIEIEDPDDFRNKMISLLEQNVYPPTGGAVILYQFSPSRYIFTIRVQNQPNIHLVNQDDRVYVLDNGKPTPLPIQKIIDLAEVNIARRYNHLSISGRIADISTQLSGLQDTIDILSIVKKIEKKITLFTDVFKAPTMGGIITDELLEHVEFSANGSPDGNLILTPAAVSPRFESHYLRLSAPIGLCDEKTYKFDEKFRLSGLKLIISAGGGVFYDQHENIFVFGNRWEPAIFTEQKQGYELDYLYIAMYLKSAISIWYTSRCLGSVDLRSFSTINRVVIPQKSSSPIGQDIILSAKELLNLEREYLERETSLVANINAAKQREERIDPWIKELTEGIENHNKKAAGIMNKIENLFFKEFDLNESEIAIVNKTLETNKLARFLGNAY
jgi:histidinol phosphatase-like PHP family hydrolase